MQLADDNHDGKVDQREMANAAYQLLSNPDATADEKAMGNMFATMVQGGTDGKGLFPDINGDGGVTADEMRKLAQGDGQYSSISKNDFKDAFGIRFNPDGNPISLDKLKQIADGQNDTGNTPAPAPAPAPTPGYGSAPAPAPAPAPGYGDIPVTPPSQTPAPAPTPGYGSAPAPAPAPAPGGTPSQNDMMGYFMQFLQGMMQLLQQMFQMFGGGGQRTSG
jgi:hypothetical protein